MDFSNVRFSEEHEWVRVDGDNAVIGVTDFAAGELGDIVYVELPAVGATITAGETVGTIEAVKTVADLYAPVSGTVTEINAALENNPELVNNSPFQEGWFIKVTISDAAQVDRLMDRGAYEKFIGK